MTTMMRDSNIDEQHDATVHNFDAVHVNLEGTHSNSFPLVKRVEICLKRLFLNTLTRITDLLTPVLELLRVFQEEALELATESTTWVKVVVINGSKTVTHFVNLQDMPSKMSVVREYYISTVTYGERMYQDYYNLAFSKNPNLQGQVPQAILAGFQAITFYVTLRNVFMFYYIPIVFWPIWAYIVLSETIHSTMMMILLQYIMIEVVDLYDDYYGLDIEILEEIEPQQIYLLTGEDNRIQIGEGASPFYVNNESGVSLDEDLEFTMLVVSSKTKYNRHIRKEEKKSDDRKAPVLYRRINDDDHEVYQWKAEGAKKYQMDIKRKKDERGKLFKKRNKTFIKNSKIDIEYLSLSKPAKLGGDMVYYSSNMVLIFKVLMNDCIPTLSDETIPVTIRLAKAFFPLIGLLPKLLYDKLIGCISDSVEVLGEILTKHYQGGIRYICKNGNLQKNEMEYTGGFSELFTFLKLPMIRDHYHKLSAFILAFPLVSVLVEKTPEQIKPFFQLLLNTATFSEITILGVESGLKLADIMVNRVVPAICQWDFTLLFTGELTSEMEKINRMTEWTTKSVSHEDRQAYLEKFELATSTDTTDVLEMYSNEYPERLLDFKKIQANYKTKDLLMIMHIKRLLEETHCSLQAQLAGTRIVNPPYVVLFYGAPGCGKSFLSNLIAGALSPNLDIPIGKNGPATYTVPATSKYMDMYAGQKVVYIDDMGQLVEPSKELMNGFIKMIGSLPYFPDMAGVEEKGRILMNPNLVICTSNSPTMGIEKEITNYGAGMRRVRIHVEVLGKVSMDLDSPQKLYRLTRVEITSLNQFQKIPIFENDLTLKELLDFLKEDTVVFKTEVRDYREKLDVATQRCVHQNLVTLCPECNPVGSLTDLPYSFVYEELITLFFLYLGFPHIYLIRFWLEIESAKVLIWLLPFQYLLCYYIYLIVPQLAVFFMILIHMILNSYTVVIFALFILPKVPDFLLPFKVNVRKFTNHIPFVLGIYLFSESWTECVASLKSYNEDPILFYKEWHKDRIQDIKVAEIQRIIRKYISHHILEITAILMSLTGFFGLYMMLQPKTEIKHTALGERASEYVKEQNLRIDELTSAKLSDNHYRDKHPNQYPSFPVRTYKQNVVHNNPESRLKRSQHMVTINIKFFPDGFECNVVGVHIGVDMYLPKHAFILDGSRRKFDQVAIDYTIHGLTKHFIYSIVDIKDRTGDKVSMYVGPGGMALKFINTCFNHTNLTKIHIPKREMSWENTLYSTRGLYRSTSLDTKALLVPASSVPGDSGTLVYSVAYKDSSFKTIANVYIIGMVSGQALENTVVTLFDEKDFKDNPAGIDIDTLATDLEGEVKSDPMLGHFPPSQQQMIYLKTIPSLRGKTSGSNFVKTRLYDKFIHHCPQSEIPDPREFKRDGEWFSSHFAALSQYLDVSQYVNREILTMAVKEVKNYMFRQIVDDPNYKPFLMLDCRSAVNGIDGLSRSLNFKTSYGPTRPGTKDMYLFGSKLFKDDPYVYLDKITVDSMIEIIEQSKRGDVYVPLAVGTVKDEITTHKKNQNQNLRIFCATTTPFLIVLKIYFGTFFERMQAIRERLFCAIGIDATSIEWDNMVKKIQKDFDIECVMDTDFSKFDKRVNLVFEAMTIVSDILLLSPDYKGEEVLLRSLSQSVAMYIIILRGEAYLTTTGVPSGVYGTSHINCICEAIIEVMVYILCIKDAYKCNSKDLNRIFTQELPFFDNVFLVNYGDDNLKSINKKIQKLGFYTPERIFDITRRCGYDLTAADKSGKPLEWRHITKTTFLKRYFVWSTSLEQWMAPLEKESIYRMLCFRNAKTELSAEDREEIVCDEALRQMFLWGPTNYEVFKVEYQPFYHKELPSYNQMEERYITNQKDNVPFILYTSSQALNVEKPTPEIPGVLKQDEFLLN